MSEASALYLNYLKPTRKYLHQQRIRIMIVPNTPYSVNPVNAVSSVNRVNEVNAVNTVPTPTPTPTPIPKTTNKIGRAHV